MSQAILAIDPGASGGIAYLDNDGNPWVHKMPETLEDVADFLLGLKAATHGDIQAYLEKVGGYIAGNKLPGSAMFNFGMNYGFIRGCLQTLAIPVELVTPQHWQSVLHMGKKTKDMTKTEWKNYLKGEAQRRYPAIKVINDTADALLILSYGKIDQRVERLV